MMWKSTAGGWRDKKAGGFTGGSIVVAEEDKEMKR